MKKSIILAVSAIAALSLASCQKEVAPAEELKLAPETINFNITVADPVIKTAATPDGTKAVKEGWEAGDKLSVWLDGRTDVSTPDFVLTFDGSAWKAGSIREGIVFDPEEGFMTTLYESRNDLSKYEFPSSSTSLLRFPRKDLISDYYPSYSIPLTLWGDVCAYYYDPETRTFTSNLKWWNYLTDLQVVVTGLPSDKTYSLALSSVGTSPDAVQLSHHEGFSIYSVGGGVSSLGMDNADGVAFYFSKQDPPADKTEVTFNLLSSDGYCYTYTTSILFKGEENGRAVFQAAKIPFSKFELNNVQGHEVVDMGDGHMWAEMNVFARVPEDAGYFYAWGEVFSKETYTSGNYTYTDAPSILPASADAAAQNFGDKWRTPTVADWEWLIANCTWNPVHDVDDHNVYSNFRYEIVSKINSNKIILPCVGYSAVTDPYCCYWTSELSESYSTTARALYWDDAGQRPGGTNGGMSPFLDLDRYLGLPIRPVI